MCNFLEYKGTNVHAVFGSSSASQSPISSAQFPIEEHNVKLTPLCPPDSKVVYRRYASLFFIAGCASTDNELITLEIVHRYVEQMDKYYGNVCELDIIFNFQKAYFILDELLLAGELQETSKKNVLRCISQQDSLEDMEVSRSTSVFGLPFAFVGHWAPTPQHFLDIVKSSKSTHVSIPCDALVSHHSYDTFETNGVPQRESRSKKKSRRSCRA
jgi:hypothetical protein